MKKKLQSRDTTIKVPLGKSSENTFKHMPFGTIESIDGYDFWVYEREAIEAMFPQARTWREKKKQRLAEMNNEVILLLEKPYRKGELTEEAIRSFKDHILSTWKIREIEDYYRFSVASRYSANGDNRFMFMLVDALFADFVKMAALVGGAVLHLGIVEECKTGENRVWGGHIDAYNSYFSDKTYNEVLKFLPKDESIMLSRQIKLTVGGGDVMSLLEDIRASQIGIRDDLAKVREDSARMEFGVSFLVNDRMGKIKHNQERGRKNQAKGVNDKEAERAKHNIEKALVRVHDLVRSGRLLKDACKEVCLNFHTLSNSKKFGQTRLPLKGVKKDLKPETLERYYHKKYGPKHNRKAKDAQGAIA